jgi:hypothetical protein
MDATQPPPPGGAGGVALAPEPWFNAAQIAERVGREKRAVLLWFAEGCPSEERRKGKQTFRVARLSEVRAWMQGRGLDGPGAAQAKPEATEPTAAAGPAQSRDAPNANELWAIAAKEQVERQIAMGGPVDFSSLIAESRRAIQELFGRGMPSAEAGTGEKDRWAGAYGKCVKELRQLEEARHAAEVRAGKWIDRQVAERMRVGEASIFAAELAGLPSETARAVVMALEGILPAERVEEARRRVAVAVRGLIDRRRGDVAAEIVKAVESSSGQ